MRLTPVQEPPDQVVAGLAGSADPRVMSFPCDVRLGCPNAEGGRPGWVAREAQEEVAHIDVHEVGRPDARHRAEDRGEGVLEVTWGAFGEGEEAPKMGRGDRRYLASRSRRVSRDRAAYLSRLFKRPGEREAPALVLVLKG